MDQNGPKKLKGKVKGVPTGSSVTLQGPLKDGLPQEKHLIFYSIQCPALGNLDKPDEPYAFEAREYLRTRVIGREVEFYIEYKFAEREFGRIHYNGEDLSYGLLSEGLARLLPVQAGKPAPIHYEQYRDAEAAARKAGKGVHAKTQDNSKVRDIKPLDNPSLTLERSKGQKIKGVMEEYNTGVCYVSVPELKTILKVVWPSLLTPVPNRRAGQELRLFVEQFILHRDVEVILYSYNQGNDTFSGEITTKNCNICVELLKNGYAKLGSNAIDELDVEKFKLWRSFQTEAQDAEIGIWKEQKRTEKKTTSATSEFNGKVIEVHSGDSLTVENLSNNELIRVFLANVRAPAAGNPRRGEPDKPFAFESKEFVRKNTIGKKVKVNIEFSRKIQVTDDNGKAEDKTLTFATLFLPNEKNLSELIVENGMANVTNPRQDEDFTVHIKELKTAEEAAKASSAGIFSGKGSTNISKYTDYTAPKMSSKSKQFFDFAKDDQNITGVVEAVLSGSLYKIRLDKQNCHILFALAGVRTLQSDKNIAEYDHFSKEAIRYAKESILQRDVELDFNSVNLKGVIQGSLMSKKSNFSVELIERGFAFVDSNPKAQSRFQSLYRTSEQKAKDSKMGIWKTNLHLGESQKTRTTKTLNITKQVFVSEIVEAQEFYVQSADSRELDSITNELSKFKEASEAKLEAPVKKGTPCLAKFSEDKQWYRAVVDKAVGQTKYTVTFTDFGNSDDVHINDLRKIPASLLAYEPQAKKCSLAYLIVPEYEQPSGEKAGNKLRELVWEKKLTANFVYEDNKYRYVVLFEKGNDIKTSVNYKLISAGLAKVDESVDIPTNVATVLREEEENIKNKRIGVHATGELSEDEDDY